MAIDLKNGEMLNGKIDDTPIGASVPSTIAVAGIGVAIAPAVTTAAYAIPIISKTTPVDATAAAAVCTLPTAASCFANGVGGEFTLAKVDAGANSVTLKGSGAETISGSNTVVLALQWASVTVQSTGTSWLIIAKA